jgi:hypothetical protein
MRVIMGPMGLSGISKRMILIISALSAAFIIAGILYFRSFSLAYLTFAGGVIWGSALNALKVIMLDRTVKKAVSMPAERAGRYVGVQHLLRLLLTGLALVLAALAPQNAIWGAAAGVITYHFAAYALKRHIAREGEMSAGAAAAPGSDQEAS